MGLFKRIRGGEQAEPGPGWATPMSASETTAFVAAVTDAAEEGDARVRELARDFEGTGSISPSLYWWRQGSVTQLPARYDGRDVHFMPPDDFFAALNALPAAG